MPSYTDEQIKQAWNDYIYEEASLSDDSTPGDYLEVQYLYNRYKEMISSK